ncbi:TetR-like C-terminal domain-containing protein [Paracerasibacillus soli]|uniref:TetR-like C-terminal domain-containing protein n=1 Tax=Paracerasibacillus soli TaxID=480284 RepID=A0ABU5CRI6_9BACI|nr:TetR-like C-terminal domain-containing protein [Virgibacillus soli]MDY0408978.1 TetR-like C-terminal domain-containing protein [Virgibacillus soli]
MDNEIEDLKNSLKVCPMEFQYQYDLPHPSLIRLFEQMMRKEKFYKIMLAEKKIPYFIDRVMDILEAYAKSGIAYLANDGVKFNTPIEIRIPYITNAYLGVMIWWLKSDMPYTPTYMAKQLTIISTVGSFEKNPFLQKEANTSQTIS